MYNYHLRFYFVGQGNELFHIIKEMPPMHGSVHSFAESGNTEAFTASEADVIFANLESADAKETVKALSAAKRADAELIALADCEQIRLLTEELPMLADIWRLPMTEEEIRFRFLRWQQNRKCGKGGSLEDEEHKWKQDQLLQALSADYNQVCYFDLNTGRGTSLRAHVCRYGVVDEVFNPNRPVKDDMERYIQMCVHEEDREFMRKTVTLENLQAELKEKQTYIVGYRTNCAGHIHHFQLKAVRAGDWKENKVLVLGIRNVDDETRSEMERMTLLENALAQANHANKAKSRFLSNMSHDIRTPMNAIVGFTALAISHSDKKEMVKGYLEKIKAAGDHLLSLINNVLDMSHIESGKIQMEETPCSLTDILNGVGSIVQAGIAAKKLKLHIETDVVNENVYCDKLRLNQVLLNLLNNAMKYTNPGGTISLKVTESVNTLAGYADYEFQVKDTGIGMSEEFIERIFEPFERERNSTLSGIQGTGLGMSITKNIVEMMNGSIDVKSTQGAGTEIAVRFPLRLCTEEKQNCSCAADCSAETAEKEPAHTRSGCILLVEDNEINQEVAVAILSEAGFCVETADNGQIALDMLKSAETGHYRLILMDVQMPVMDGYEATRAIRALDNPALSSIPIIAMTANAFEEDKREALKSGMNGHAAKPIDVDVLFDMIDMVLG